MSPSVQSPSSPPASPSTLAGSGTQPDQDAQSTSGGQGESGGQSSPNDALRQTVQKLRGMEMDLMELAQRFPSAASAIRQATTSIRAALRQVIANPGQPEPRAPNIGG